jgi:hypothetical protein
LYRMFPPFKFKFSAVPVVDQWVVGFACQKCSH